ncbi:4-hydroxybenzoate octaprenyltransferase [Pseudoalteromonas aurantia]|uniref:4-hydroxybenzoate octaprenyltransferase n=1 Tax=Pseudoalteromonas aurantia 208 TaxID=1314867 RepID=A0ABR9E8M1_9GAMM|nr:4-hydroxybenzoate octaprenyltransferase [Pseudoalteromonas aurantia]MBE0367097.1 4-hydroxybenzoate octaprenyltransferase [Pseudoalteromonas aurantia 208]
MQFNVLKVKNIPEYKQLMRLDKPIGTLLLLWPTLCALWIANNGIPQWSLLIIFTLGVFVMRSAGCVINDFADRKVDGAVQRTSGRPLARKAIKAGEALTLFTGLIFIAFLLVIQLNLKTVALSLVALALASCYPFMKRFTHLPQVVLGAAYSFSIPMAFMATNDVVPTLAWLLFIANLVWTVAYDTMYAMVDRDDDVKIGVKSTAILFGSLDRHWIAMLNSCYVAIMGYVGYTQALSLAYWVGLFLAGVLLVNQQRKITGRDRTACFKSFLNNNYVGMAIFVGLATSMAV